MASFPASRRYSCDPARMPLVVGGEGERASLVVPAAGSRRSILRLILDGSRAPRLRAVIPVVSFERPAAATVKQRVLKSRDACDPRPGYGISHRVFWLVAWRVRVPASSSPLSPGSRPRPCRHAALAVPARLRSVLFLHAGLRLREQCAAERRFQNVSQGYSISRFSNPTVRCFEARMGLAEGRRGAARRDREPACGGQPGRVCLVVVIPHTAGRPHVVAANRAVRLCCRPYGVGRDCPPALTACLTPRGRRHTPTMRN